MRKTDRSPTPAGGERAGTQTSEEMMKLLCPYCKKRIGLNAIQAHKKKCCVSYLRKTGVLTDTATAAWKEAKR